MTLRLWRLALLLWVTLAVGGTQSIAHAANIDPAHKFAWGENVGWSNFAPSQGPGVTVTPSTLTGFVWAENIGWVNLSPTTAGVFNDGQGNLSGFAWGENVGWINFAPMGAGVHITPDGFFMGFAWGENIGWINFAPTGGGVRVLLPFGGAAAPAPALGGTALLAALALLALTARRALRRGRSAVERLDGIQRAVLQVNTSRL